MNLYNWQGKLRRSINILADESEIFEDCPYFRFSIIAHIWREKP